MAEGSFLVDATCGRIKLTEGEGQLVGLARDWFHAVFGVLGSERLRHCLLDHAVKGSVRRIIFLVPLLVVSCLYLFCVNSEVECIVWADFLFLILCKLDGLV